MRVTTAVICLVLGGTALTSHALTLGRARGAAWIGQTLQVSVSVTLEPGQSADGQCPEADVFYADTKVEANRVQVSLDSSNQVDTFTLRIQTSTPIDEPVVTVYARVGCNNKTARRYVMLADYASDVAAIAAQDTTLVPAVQPLRQTAPPAGLEDAAVQGRTGLNATSPVRADRAIASTRSKPAKVQSPRLPAPKSTTTDTKPPLTPQRARLQLDPLETLNERVKTLEATTATAPPRDGIQDSQRIQQLQSDVKALLDQAAKNEAAMFALRQRLNQAESERITNIAMYAFLAVTVIALTAGLVLWNRKARVPPWPSETEASAPRVATPVREPSVELNEADPADDWSHPRHETLPGMTLPAAHASATARVPMHDLEADEFVNSVSVSHPAEASDSDLMGFGEPELLHPNFNHSALLDVAQQVEFFLTLGNANSAIEVLERRIRDNPNDCPTVYLQLLEVANRYNLKTDFRLAKEKFSALFNAEIPEFALFRHEGKALEDYPDLLTHIAKVWPSTKVMDVIEACVRFNPQDKYATRFDLAAFRDLILLHGLVRYQTYHPSIDTPQTRTQPTDAGEADDLEHIALDL